MSSNKNLQIVTIYHVFVPLLTSFLISKSVFLYSFSLILVYLLSSLVLFNIKHFFLIYQCLLKMKKFLHNPNSIIFFSFFSKTKRSSNNIKERKYNIILLPKNFPSSSLILLVVFFSSLVFELLEKVSAKIFYIKTITGEQKLPKRI